MNSQYSRIRIDGTIQTAVKTFPQIWVGFIWLRKFTINALMTSSEAVEAKAMVLRRVFIIQLQATTIRNRYDTRGGSLKGVAR